MLFRLRVGADAVVFGTCLYVGAADFIIEALLWYDESHKYDIRTEENFCFNLNSADKSHEYRQYLFFVA